MRYVIVLALVLGALAALPDSTRAASCTAESRPQRVPLLELYTSEGCDSCPPADRWVSELPRRGLAAGAVVVLAFHVDYWDRLGWKDPYGQARFSERQRVLNNRNRARFVYTPQLVLNGGDYRRGSHDDFASRVAEISRAPAKAAMRLALASAPAGVTVSGAWSGSEASHAQGWVALYENGLSTDVKAGENRNKRLHHDYVVRDIAGPFPSGAFAHAFKVDPQWKRGDLAVAGFVQDARSGDVLQALALDVCR